METTQPPDADKLSSSDRNPPDRIDEDLFNYAIDRDEVKYLLAQLPGETSVKPVKVEYELQILKIIGVGWGLSFHLQENPAKDRILTCFWQSVQQFAKNLSETTGLMIGQEINYFSTVKERLDHYIAAMADHSGGDDPLQVIGPEFADICGNREDIFAVMTGAKMFNSTLVRVRQYLQAVDLV
jgi:hypothetical protein